MSKIFKQEKLLFLLDEVQVFLDSNKGFLRAGSASLSLLSSFWKRVSAISLLEEVQGKRRKGGMCLFVCFVCYLLASFFISFPTIISFDLGHVAAES